MSSLAPTLLIFAPLSKKLLTKRYKVVNGPLDLVRVVGIAKLGFQRLGRLVLQITAFGATNIV